MAKAGASSGLGSGVGGGPPADPRRSSSAARPETSLSGTCGGSRWMRRRQNRKEEKRGRNKGTRLTVVRNKERIAESLGHGTDSVFRWFCRGVGLVTFARFAGKSRRVNHTRSDVVVDTV